MVVNDTNNTAADNTHFFHTVFPVTRSSNQKFSIFRAGS